MKEWGGAFFWGVFWVWGRERCICEFPCSRESRITRWPVAASIHSVGSSAASTVEPRASIRGNTRRWLYIWIYMLVLLSCDHGLAISTAKTCVGPSILERKTTHFMSGENVTLGSRL